MKQFNVLLHQLVNNSTIEGHPTSEDISDVLKTIRMLLVMSLSQTTSLLYVKQATIDFIHAFSFSYDVKKELIVSEFVDPFFELLQRFIDNAILIRYNILTISGYIDLLLIDHTTDKEIHKDRLKLYLVDIHSEALV